MTPTEAVLLTRYVKACCPQQQIDDYTPDAWHDLLGDLTLDDCRQAVKAVATRQPFVSPSEIRDEVRRIRDDRLRDRDLAVPAADPDDPAAYIRALRAQTTAIADGRHDVPALPAGNADGEDSPTVRRIRAQFDAERAKARQRKAAEAAAERQAVRAYMDAVAHLLDLPDHGEAAMTAARKALFGDEQAAQGFPLAADRLGVTDDHKVVILAAEIAREQP